MALRGSNAVLAKISTALWLVCGRRGLLCVLNSSVAVVESWGSWPPFMATVLQSRSHPTALRAVKRWGP
eukprot:jgi/Phyca11/507858/fgenesh2_kg.PHYCAscaffold_30_\